MSGFFYYLLTFVESITSVFGLRFPYEQPRYAVIQELGQSVEIRRYDPREAIEATVAGTNREKAAGEAFTLLFRYITGANKGEQKIAMTVPVRTDTSERIAMTAPVQTTTADNQVSMRFFLPRSVVQSGAPAPLDPRLHLVPGAHDNDRCLAILRCGDQSRTRPSDRYPAWCCGEITVAAGWAYVPISYDPPFAIPFLRRNEIAVPVTR